MKTIDITKKSMKREKSGGILVNFSYVLTNELGEKKEGTGSFAVSQEDAIPSQIQATLKHKLGYSGFTINPDKPARPVLGVNR